VFLGIAVLYVVTRPAKEASKAANPKKSISWIRLAYERFDRALTGLRNVTGLTPCNEGLV
jgi:hypothetical protein